MMPPSQYTPTQYGLLKVGGNDAKKFLQGQLTCDVEHIREHESLLGAHCSPQGRVISLFNLFIYQHDYYLLMPAILIPIALTALKKYAVFYKLVLERVVYDPLIVPQALNESLPENVANGIPTIFPETTNKFLPHELNLQKLNAISFTKGCYTGQEIIARMQYRGKLKTYLFQAKISSDSLLIPGTELYYQSSQKVEIGGTIINAMPLMDNNSQQSNQLILLVCGEANAKNNHLYLDPHFQTSVTFFHAGDHINV